MFSFDYVTNFTSFHICVMMLLSKIIYFLLKYVWLHYAWVCYKLHLIQSMQNDEKKSDYYYSLMLTSYACKWIMYIYCIHFYWIPFHVHCIYDHEILYETKIASSVHFPNIIVTHLKGNRIIIPISFFNPILFKIFIPILNIDARSLPILLCQFDRDVFDWVNLFDWKLLMLHVIMWLPIFLSVLISSWASWSLLYYSLSKASCFMYRNKTNLSFYQGVFQLFKSP